MTKHRAGANPGSIYETPLSLSEFAKVSREQQQRMFADPTQFSKYWHLYVTAMGEVAQQDAGVFLLRHIEILEAEIQKLKNKQS